MKVNNLTTDNHIYTSNVYLVTGDWNTIKDTNTLIDVGRDPSIFEKINEASTGVGKQKIEQVIITHNHYDHASLLLKIKQEFNPTVYAYSTSLEGVDHYLYGGEKLKIGDKIFEVIYTPGHSNDSICLYCSEEKVLFAGDTPVVILSSDGVHDPRLIEALEKLTKRDVETIYFGHGIPLKDGCNRVLAESLKNAKGI